MADKFLNLTAVQTIKTWATGLFAKDADLDTLSSRVDDIVAEGGEPNVIEIIKKNGTALTPDANKAVDIPIPTVAKSGSGETEKVTVTEGQNSYDVPTVDAMEDYVGEHGGVIQKIKNNGTDMPIDSSDKSVNFTNATSSANGLMSSADKSKLDAVEAGAEANVQSNWNEADSTSDAYIANKPTIPTAVSDLTNDSGYQTASDVQSAIASGVASAVKLKGSVASYSALPSTGNTHGDMYDTLDTGKNYVWIYDEGTQTGRWDDYAGTMDLSAYWTSTTGQTNTLEAATVSEINAILNA